MVGFRETVSELSSQTCLSKSKNKHNRLYVRVQTFFFVVVRGMVYGCVWADLYG